MSTGPETDYALPGKAESYWLSTTPESSYPSPSEDVEVDVAIVGGGIVGITSALLLKQAGLSVAVIEAGRILHGVSGQTTAKVTSQHHLIYDRLISHFGEDQARQYAESNQAAIDKIASLVRSENIDCDLIYKPAYVYAGSLDSVEKIHKEVDAAKNLGLPASFDESPPLPFGTHGAVRFDKQAQFHPRKYLCALAQQIPGGGSHIFEEQQVHGIEGEGPVNVKTHQGITVKAQDVVQATHFPIVDRPGMLFSRLYQSRSYLLGVRIDEPFPDGMFINAEKPARSMRSQPADDGELVLVAGEEHRTGEGNNTIGHYRRLEEWVRSVYPVNSIDYHWSTQDVMPADGVPYIGRITSGSKHSYLATGFRKWGMTTGTVAAMIISDMILGKDNSWAPVYNPSRFKPVESAKQIFSQTVESTKGLVGARVLPLHEDAAHIVPGTGAIVKIGGERVAAYRDDKGDIHALDPACRHMGCFVSWNNAENTWDCPCHGSRYNVKGEVVHNPAVHNLSEKNVNQNKVKK
ncbi:FAD-dependent oxidoreductase [Methanolobus halotolerans]|uniref:FAD-dependent oxidoreductase n=1 Tax=Methanolobus halotolerans TaxID=2052935 RepID=A0A4E0PWQ6_9EURY|nr:FAD-dependent oxidoreductase [Methanolobus halotolerans]TGC09821.1 FAD-dependent oxidoreductase [Methanolobus halotolerans]